MKGGPGRVGAAPPRKRRQPAPDEPSSGSEPEEAPASSAKRARLQQAQKHQQQQQQQQRGMQFDSEGDASGDSQSDQSEGHHSSGEEEEGLPLGELVRLRQDGSTSGPAMRARAQALRQAGQALKREGKHRPVEQSSKRPVPVFREALQGGKREVRDPRFETLTAGEYSEGKFKKQYAFLYEEQLPAERKELKAALGKAKSSKAREALQARLEPVEQTLRSEEARRKREAFQAQLKAKEREAVSSGKRPYFLKKTERRRQELVAKYEELRGSGKLEQYMAKRRKRNAAKDHRYLPSGRRQQQGGDED